MYSATARTSSSDSGSGGMPRSARLPRTIGRISSPCLVVEDDERAQEIRAAELAAAQVGAVAGGARRGVDAASALDQRGIARRPLLRGEGPRLRAAARRPGVRPGGGGCGACAGGVWAGGVCGGVCAPAGAGGCCA